MTVWLFGWSRYEYEVLRPLSDFPLAHEEEGKGRGEVPEKIWSRMDMARMRKEDEASRIMREKRKKVRGQLAGLMPRKAMDLLWMRGIFHFSRGPRATISLDLYPSCSKII